jgi:hypothetical protein
MTSYGLASEPRKPNKQKIDNYFNDKTYYLLLLFLLAFQLVPIWFSPYPAMSDYPNHLARSFILFNYDSNQLFQETYDLEFVAVPNLAMDLIVSWLMKYMSIETASKVFLSSITLLFGFGLHLLGCAVNKRPYWNSLVAMFFLFNFSWAYGFANYMFGMGLFLISLAVWLRFCSSWNLFRVIILMILALACYISHLAAFVFLGLSVIALTAFEVMKARTIKLNNIAGLTPLLPPTLVYFWYVSGIEKHANLEWWQPFLLKK